MKNLTVVSHPLIEDELCKLRHKETKHLQFRSGLKKIGRFLVYEATKNLSLTEVTIETPVTSTQAKQLTAQPLVLVPILRAGLAFLEAALEILPDATVGHIGLQRDEETLESKAYYAKLPKNTEQSITFVLDPMLATGNSAVSAISKIKGSKPAEIFLICLVAAPEGVAQVNEAHPDVKIYCAALDSHLNGHGYIVPGLGDAGDRVFGTL